MKRKMYHVEYNPAHEQWFVMQGDRVIRVFNEGAFYAYEYAAGLNTPTEPKE